MTALSEFVTIKKFSEKHNISVKRIYARMAARQQPAKTKKAFLIYYREEDLLPFIEPQWKDRKKKNKLTNAKLNSHEQQPEQSNPVVQNPTV